MNADLDDQEATALGVIIGGAITEAAGLVERAKRAVDGNPWNPSEDPEMYRRWDAASEVTRGPCSTVVVAATISAGWRNHAAVEGIEYDDP